MVDRIHRQRATGVPPTPPATECDRRLQQIRSQLENRDFQGMIIFGDGPTNPDPIRYFSGYVHPFPRARSLLFISVEREPVLLVDREWHLDAARKMTWIDDVRLMPTPNSADQADLVDSLSDALIDSGFNSGTVGLLGTDFPAKILEGISTTEVNIDIESASRIWQDIVANPSEYDRAGVQRAIEIADRGLAALESACEPGRSESAVAFDVLAELAAEGAEFQHANSISTHVDIGVYARSKSNLQPFLYTESSLESGEMFWVDIIVCWNGYYVDCDRTVSIGEPSSEQRRLYDACREMYLEMVAAVEPGVTGSEVWRAANRIAVKYGYEDYLNNVYLGHTTGSTISSPPIVGPNEIRELSAGQFLNIEPAIHVPGIGSACIENTLRVDTDVVQLNSAPIDMIVV